MRSSTRPSRTLAFGGALICAVLSAASVGAQAPIVSTTPPVVIVVGGGATVPLSPIIVIPPVIPGGDLHGGPWPARGRADVEVDIDRSHEPGQVVVR
jgi:hypothetical protein